MTPVPGGTTDGFAESVCMAGIVTNVSVRVNAGGGCGCCGTCKIVNLALYVTVDRLLLAWTAQNTKFPYRWPSGAWDSNPAAAIRVDVKAADISKWFPFEACYVREALAAYVSACWINYRRVRLSLDLKLDGKRWRHIRSGVAVGNATTTTTAEQH